MGAVEFREDIIAKNAKDGFRSLVDYYTKRNGGDPYNGTISTCRFNSQVKKISSRYSKENAEKIAALVTKEIDKNDWGRKWEATCLDLGVEYYEVVTFKKVKPEVKKAPIWKKMYVVVNDKNGKVEAEKEKKTEASEKAMELAMKNPDSGYSIHYIPVNTNSGNEVVEEIKIEKEKIYSEKKPREKKNQKIFECHRYVFYGLASD